MDFRVIVMLDIVYVYQDEKIKLIIDKDIVGYYLIVYRDPKSTISSADYLLDTLDEAFEAAQKKFGISKEQWKSQK